MIEPVAQNFYISVDGTDCRISEPSPFSPSWYSHKFHGAGLRYEIGLSISNSNIVWANGPFPCGDYPDVKIFKNYLAKRLAINERIVADKGYKNDRCFYNIPNHPESFSSRIRARHETVNRRLKHFSVLGSMFRHDISLHSACFHAALNLTQLMISHSEPLFQI